MAYPGHRPAGRESRVGYTGARCRRRSSSDGGDQSRDGRRRTGWNWTGQEQTELDATRRAPWPVQAPRESAPQPKTAAARSRRTDGWRVIPLTCHSAELTEVCSCPDIGIKRPSHLRFSFTQRLSCIYARNRVFRHAFGQILFSPPQLIWS